MNKNDFDSAVNRGNFWKDGQRPSPALLKVYYRRVEHLDAVDGEKILGSVIRHNGVTVQCGKCGESSAVLRTHTFPGSVFRCGKCGRVWNGGELENSILRRLIDDKVFPACITA